MNNCLELSIYKKGMLVAKSKTLEGDFNLHLITDDELLTPTLVPMDQNWVCLKIYLLEKTPLTIQKGI